MYPASLRGHPPPRTESGIQVVTDSHNSGQHKDREAAAAEGRRMWQPTPSWSQPDPNQTPDAEPAADRMEGQPDALSKAFPGDSWSPPAAQPAPWATPQHSASGSSWTQPAADTAASWTQPPPESDEHETGREGAESDDAAKADSGTATVTPA